MTSWLLVPTTLILTVLLFLSIVLWPVFPDWFGVFGYKRKTKAGKLFIRLLVLFPVITAISLYIAWSKGADSPTSYIALLPLTYIVLLWLNKLDKNKRCFITKQENTQHFMDNLDEQLNSLDRFINNEDEIALSFFSLVPGSVPVDNIKSAISPYCQYTRHYISGGYIINKVDFIEGFTPIMPSPDKASIEKSLTQLIETIWDAGGELGGWNLVPQKRVSDTIELNNP